MREIVTTVCEVAGLALIAGAAWTVDVTAGLAAAGVALVLVGWTGSR